MHLLQHVERDRRTNNASHAWTPLMATLALMTACTPPPPDVEPGPNGEVGKELTRIYSKEFRVRERDYFEVLEEFYRFAQVNRFDFVNSGECFSEVLAGKGQRFTLSEPCRAMWAVTGAPTKAHMNLTILEKSVHRLDRNDHYQYQIEIFVHRGIDHAEALGPEFQQKVEPKLSMLSSAVPVAATQ